MMVPLEMYWPPEMLAQVFPERYGHLAMREALTLHSKGRGTLPPYKIEQRGSCTIVWLGRGEGRTMIAAFRDR